MPKPDLAPTAPQTHDFCRKVPAILAEGRFRITRALGNGSLGAVYEAYDQTRNEFVALKLLNRLEPNDIYHLKNEFRSLAGTSHPNLIRLHDLFAEGDLWFFSMELVRGAHFDQWVRPAGALDMPRLRNCLSQLTTAVRALHLARKLHRDLKPSNVLVGADGRLVVLDFGLVVDRELGAGETLTDHGICGTPLYMAPEQAAGHPACAASDAYAIGTMLYEALTGRPPFEGTVGEVLFAKQLQTPEPPSRRVQDVPQDLDQLCAELLAIEPSRRPSDDELCARTSRVSDPEGGVSLQPAPPMHTRTTHTLVARDNELRVLQSAIRSTLSDQPTLVVVSGPSGIGKTALCESFMAQEVDRAPCVVLRGRCYERESIPFKAIDPLIDALARYVRALPPEHAAATMPRDVFALAKLFPSLSRLDVVSSMPVKDVRDPQELRRRAFAALGEWLARIRDRTPVVVAIDDVHWACADSIAGLHELLLTPAPAPILVILCRRDARAASTTPLDRLLASLGNAGTWKIEDVALGPLAPADAKALIAQSLPEQNDISASVVTRVAIEARGNPFIARELAQFAQSGHRPATLAKMLVHHYEQCSEPARRIVDTLALAGEPLAADTLLRAAAASFSDLEYLRAASLVRTSAAGEREPAHVECYHDQIAELLRTEVSRRRARSLYGALAQSLVGCVDPRPELVSRCFELSGNHIAAAQYASQAAEEAEHALAFERAAGLYGKAIELGLSDASLLGPTLVRQSTCLHHAGESVRAAQLLMRAASLASGIEQVELRHTAAVGLLVSGHIADGWTLFREVANATGLGCPSTPSGRRMGAWDVWSEQRAASGPLEVNLRLRVQRTATAITLWFSPHARAVLHRYLDAATAARDPEHVRRALGYCAMAYGQLAASTAEANTYLSRFDSADPGARTEPGSIGTVHGVSLYPRSRLKHARERLSHARSELHESGRFRDELDIVEIWDRCCAAAAGDLADLTHSTSRLVDEAYRRNRVFTATMLLGGGGALAWLTRDDPSTYRRRLLEATERWEDTCTRHSPTELYGPDVRWSTKLVADSLALASAARDVSRLLPREQYAPDAELWLGDMLVELYDDRPECAYALALECARRFPRGAGAGSGAHGSWLVIASGQCLASLLRDARDEELIAEYRRGLTGVVAALHASGSVFARSVVAGFEAALALHDGHPERCHQLLRETIVARDAAELAMYAAAARRTLGQQLAGDEGAQLVATAEGFMRQQGVRNIEAMTELHCAGFRM